MNEIPDAFRTLTFEIAKAHRPFLHNEHLVSWWSRHAKG
jgi:hypothetical protein